MRTAFAAAAVAVGVACSALAPTPAAAWGWWDFSVAPERPEIRHHVYKPRYTHLYFKHGDPYAYRYVRRGYYPYAASQYWVPADHMRNRYRYHYEGPKYVYQPSWGRPVHPRAHVPAAACGKC